MTETKETTFAEEIREAAGGAILVMIPAEKIRPNEKNFYEMSDLDTLAASIDQNGQLDPVKVRADGDGYTIIDGERRFRAMTEILGREAVQCRIMTPQNEIAEELILIESNRTQRKMSSAELSKQAERYTELLSQLKDSGMKISGRLRDRVAEALQVSSTKLARLHAIRERLSPRMLERFDAGEINESMAYALSRYSHGQQAGLWDYGARTPEAVDIVARRAGFSVGYRDAAEAQPDEAKTEEPKTAEPTGTSWDAEAYLKQRQDEDDKYREALEYHARQFIGTLDKCYERREGIERLKSCFGCLYAGHSSFDAPSYKSSPKGLEISFRELDLRCVTRTWTEVYDMLSIIALHGVAAIDDDEGVSEMNHRPAGIVWHDTEREGPPPAGAANVICWGDAGLYKPMPHLIREEFDTWPENCRWWATVEGPEV